MPTDDASEQPPPLPGAKQAPLTQPANNTRARAEPLSWLWKFDQGINVVKGLSLFTVLSSLVVAYFQSIGAYEEKVRARAASDMSAAKDTFNDISKKFSDAQTLLQLLFRDFAAASDQNASDSARRLAMEDAQVILKKYDEARLVLLDAGEVMVRNAEIHIDWATEFVGASRQPYPNSDPLTRTLLRDRNFDCDNNLPDYRNSQMAGQSDVCLGQFAPLSWETSLCPTEKVKGRPVRIDWFSTKHQVLTMHYCFHALHERLASVRSWASGKDAGPAVAGRTELEQMQKAVDNQAARLNAFMGLALFQMDAIRQNYQPVGFLCHIPLVSSLPFMERCNPIRTTPIWLLPKS